MAENDTHDIVSLLCSSERNYLVRNNGDKVPVYDLVGKVVLLYFSAHWCPPCCRFTPKLIEVYHKIKAKDDQFEVIFISSDRDQSSFEEYFSDMPWLALPFGDDKKKSLSLLFDVREIPTLVAIGKNGNTITTDARDLVMLHGESAYPFTEERLKEIEEEYKEIAKGWPEKVKHTLHEHELVLTRLPMYTCDGCDEVGELWSFKCEECDFDPRLLKYTCDGCDEVGELWSFKCEECDFDLHPKCALGEDKGNKDDAAADVAAAAEDVDEKEKPKDGWVCEGNVCHKA